jgi:hypothetical protein
MTDVEQGLYEAIRLRLLDDRTLRDMEIKEIVRATGGGFAVLGRIRSDNWGCWLTSLDNPAALTSGVYGSEVDCRSMLARRSRKGGTP